MKSLMKLLIVACLAVVTATSGAQAQFRFDFGRRSERDRDRGFSIPIPIPMPVPGQRPAERYRPAPPPVVQQPQERPLTRVENEELALELEIRLSSFPVRWEKEEATLLAMAPIEGAGISTPLNEVPPGTWDIWLDGDEWQIVGIDKNGVYYDEMGKKGEGQEIISRLIYEPKTGRMTYGMIDRQVH